MSRAAPRSSTNSVSLFPFLAVLVCAMGALIFLLLVTTRQIRSDVLAKAKDSVDGPVAMASDTGPLVLPGKLADDDDADQTVSLSKPDDEDDVEEEDAARPVIPLVTLDESPKEKEDDAVVAPQLRHEEPPARPTINLAAEYEERLDELIRQVSLKQNVLESQQLQLAAVKRRVEENQKALNLVRGRVEETRRQQRLQGETGETIQRTAANVNRQIEETERRIRQVERRNVEATDDSKFVLVPFDGQSGTTRRPIFIECTEKGFRFLPENIVVSESDLQGFVESYNPLLAGAGALVRHWTLVGQSSEDGIAEEPYVLLIVRPSGSVAYYVARKLLARLNQPFGYELLDDGVEIELPDRDPQAVAVCREAIEQTLAQREEVVGDLVKAVDSTQRRIRFRTGPGGLVVEEVPDNPLDGFGSPGGASGRKSNGSGFGESRLGTAGQDRSNHHGVASSAGNAVPPQTVHGGRPGLPADSMAGEGGEGSGTGLGRNSSESRLNSNSTRPFDGNRGTGDVQRRAEVVEWDGESVRRARIEAFQDRLAADEQAQAGQRRTSDAQWSSSAATPEGEFRANDSRAARSPNRETPEEVGFADEDESLLRGHPLADRNPSERMTSDQKSGAEGSETASSRGTSSQSSEPGGARGSLPNDPLVNVGPRASLDLTDEQRSSQQRKRRQWGMASRRASIGYERELRIHVDSKWLVIGGEQKIPVGRGERTEELLEKVVKAIDEHARSWGPPPSSFYWVPFPKFVISPGGNQHYERLRGGLAQWGLSATAELTLDPLELPERSE